MNAPTDAECNDQAVAFDILRGQVKALDQLLHNMADIDDMMDELDAAVKKADREDRDAKAHRQARAYKPAEHWQAVRVQRAELAVEVGRLCLQRAEGFDGALISMRPIQAGSGEQLDIAAIDTRVHAVAVVLDLMQPV
jgi:hypothetical protein